jgi:iron complex outermembrane receptor protein
MFQLSRAESRRGVTLLAATVVLVTPCVTLAQDSLGLEEVIVTAQKRAEPLQDVPISVTVLTGEQIREMKLNSGTDVARLTPNLRASTAGNEDQPKFSIRGLSQFDTNLNASSPTGVFTDEIYTSSQFLGGPQLFDMERVEVLRGPQGTLFGKNTTAGALNFITRAPALGGESSDYISAEFGSNNYYHLQGGADLPIESERFGARVAFNTSQSDGWVKNRNPDPSARDLSSIDNYAGRLSLRYDGDGFDAIARLWLTRSTPTAIGIIGEGTCPDYCFPTFLTGGTPYPQDTNIARVNPRISPYTGQPFDAHEGAYDRSGTINVEGQGANVTLNFELGTFTLTSISSFIDGSFHNYVDADASIVHLFHIDFLADTRELSQDLRLTSDFDGPFNFILGAYFFRDVIEPATTSRFGPPASLPPLSLQSATTTYKQTRTSVAGYVDGTYALTDAAELYAGFRVTKEDGEAEDFTTVTLAGVTTLPPTDVTYDETKPTGRIGFRYEFSDDVMSYIQYSRGYRSSSINGSAACAAELNVAKPEFLDSFEVGFKSQWLDNRVQINSSVFYYNFKDQQFRNPAPGTSGCNSNNPLATQLVNAAKSRIYGIEVEAQARITSAFDIGVGVGLLESEYEELFLFDSNARITRDLSGNEVLEAPPYTVNVSTNYAIPAGSGEVVLHADSVWVGSQFYTAFNDIEPFDEQRSPANWEANARIGYRSGDGRYSVGVWGKNLNDNEAVNWAINPQVFGIKFTTVPYPRRWGVDFNLNF